MNKRLRIGLLVILSVAAIAILSGVIFITVAQGEDPSDINATIAELDGVAEVRNSEQEQFSLVNIGFIIDSIMQLQTREESRARLDLSTGSIVRLGPKTIFSITPSATESGDLLSRIELEVGKIWIVLKGGSIDVNTPGGLASVRGSYMSVWVEPETNVITVMCLEGHCGYENLAGSVALTSGQKIISADPNILPTIEKMDETDIQSWLDNCPESADIIPFIQHLIASSTPSLTPDSTPTSTNTATRTPTPSRTATLMGTRIVTPFRTASVTPTPTRTSSFFNPTATQVSQPSATDAPTQPGPSTATAQPPAPTATQPPPQPTATDVPPPTATDVPPPTATDVPPPTATQLPYP